MAEVSCARMAATRKPRGEAYSDFFGSVGTMTLPVGERAIPGGLRGYHIDFALKATEPLWPPRWMVDEAAGRDLLAASTVQWIAQWGLGCFERHLGEEEERWLRAGLDASEFLLARQEQEGPLAGACFNQTPMVHTFHLDPPWVSGMAQGEMGSLLARAFAFTGDERFAEGAASALGPLRVPTSAGGVRTPVGDGFFLEEYPTTTPSCVLNGGIYALWGLYDVGVGLDDAEAREEFELGVDTLAANIHRWDTGAWSRYDLYPLPVMNIASGAYHVLHINQLRAMQRIAPRPEIASAAERFESYLSSRAKRTAAFARKALFRLLVPRNEFLARRSPFARPRSGG